MGDAAVLTTPDGEPLQRKGRPGAVSQEVFQTLKIAGHIAVNERDPDACVHRKTTVLSSEHVGGHISVEIRAKLPLGQGIWPALWLLPEKDRYGSWAASGEIDILEAKGHEPTRIQGALHCGGRWPADAVTVREHTFERGGIDGFQVYAVDWNPGEIHWEVDGTRYGTVNCWWSSARRDGKGGVAPTGDADLASWPAPFDQPFQILVNLAVGGRFPGNPDATTPFPAEMLVDYVRVYEHAGGPPPLVPRGPGRLPFSPGMR